MLFRRVVTELRNRAKKSRKPLILRGARQVEKTTAIEVVFFIY